MSDIADRLGHIVGPPFVLTDPASRHRYGIDALKRGVPADIVALPADTAEVAAIARLCNDTRTPLVPRGGGTGYTGGAVPVRGGVVVSLERLNRIIEVDVASLVAIVEANVITGDLQDAVERVGLFYPPDPSSLRESTIGGNIAECAGGPRAFKYGVTKHYVLGLEVVLPTGEILQTGGKVVKNVVGYDLTQIIVGSEGTLAIVTKATMRLVPKPPSVITLRATFKSIRAAADAVDALIRSRVVPSSLEIVDADSLEAVAAETGAHSLAPAGTAAMLLIEVDGLETQVREEATRVESACRDAGATALVRATTEAERQDLWAARRGISIALKRLGSLKFNHDIVVPKGRMPELFDLVTKLRQTSGLRIPAFGHAGDGNIHVNVMVDRNDRHAVERAKQAEADLFRGVIALDGTITGEHGIGFSKAPYLSLALSPESIALMKRLKAAFDPNGILNPGKIFPDDVAASNIPPV